MKICPKSLLLTMSMFVLVNTSHGLCFDRCGKSSAEVVNKQADNYKSKKYGGRLVSDIDEISYCVQAKNTSGLTPGNAVNNSNKIYAMTLSEGAFCSDAYTSADPLAGKICAWVKTVIKYGWYDGSSTALSNCTTTSYTSESFVEKANRVVKTGDFKDYSIQEIQQCVREEANRKQAPSNAKYRTELAPGICNGGKLKEDLRNNWSKDASAKELTKSITAKSPEVLEQLDGICEELNATSTAWYRNENSWTYTGSTYPKFPFSENGEPVAVNSGDTPAPKAGDTASETAKSNDANPKPESKTSEGAVGTADAKP